jgi:long-chain acyl-CoA synthetase
VEGSVGEPVAGVHIELVSPGGEEAAAAVVKVTSGSTGKPRGIVTPSSALLADDEALTMSMGLHADDRLLASIPFSHSYGLSSLVVPALVRGSLLVLPSGTAPLAPLTAAAACGATVFPTVPAFIGALLKLAEPPPVPDTLRLIVTAGAPLDAQVATRFQARHGRAVHVFYGASECGGICYDRGGTAAVEGSVGEPVAGVHIELVSPGGEEAASRDGSAAGQVVVRSPAVASGYLHESSEALGSGRFISQDRGRWRGSQLSLEGRLDAMINVRGHKVDPAEVERVLAALAAVEEVAVLGVPAPGGDSDTVHAVVACPAGALSVEEVLAWCRSNLSDYKVPRSVRLVERLPRTERGKIDQAALRAGTS